MDRARSGQDDGAAGGEGEADQTLPGDFEVGESVGGDLHDSAGAGERGGDIEIAVDIEGNALRPSKTFVESAYRSSGIDLVNAIVGTGYEEISLRTECQVVGGNAELERGKDKDLLIARDFEDGAVAVADVKALVAIEGDAGGDAHAFGIGRGGAVGSDAVDSAVEAR